MDTDAAATRTDRRPRSLGSLLFARRLERLGITYDEAARQLRRAGAAGVGRSSVCHWAIGRHAPDRRNAAAVQEWSGGRIPAPAWDARAEEP